MKKFIVGLLVGLFGGTIAGIFLVFERAFRSPIMISAIKDAMADKISMMLYGEPVRRPFLPRYTPYTRYQSPRYSRVGPGFEERIVLTREMEAVDVLEGLRKLMFKYGQATVSDLHDLAGFPNTHSDVNWGWKSMAGMTVEQVRGGFRLDLPRPVPL